MYAMSVEKCHLYWIKVAQLREQRELAAQIKGWENVLPIDQYL